MNIFIGADHRGFQYKNDLVKWLTEKGHTVMDCGNSIHDPQDDYPDFAFAVGEKVVQNPDSLGIVICGSGGGICIASNKVKGIRCAQGFTPEMVKSQRSDDDMNVLAIGADVSTFDQVKEMVDMHVSTPFSGEERHNRRKQKIQHRELNP
jgi:ribose 5-phosphate isomerase B